MWEFKFPVPNSWLNVLIYIITFPTPKLFWLFKIFLRLTTYFWSLFSTGSLLQAAFNSLIFVTFSISFQICIVCVIDTFFKYMYIKNNLFWCLKAPSNVSTSECCILSLNSLHLHEPKFSFKIFRGEKKGKKEEKEKENSTVKSTETCFNDIILVKCHRQEK